MCENSQKAWHLDTISVLTIVFLCHLAAFLIASTSAWKTVDYAGRVETSSLLWCQGRAFLRLLPKLILTRHCMHTFHFFFAIPFFLTKKQRIYKHFDHIFGFREKCYVCGNNATTLKNIFMFGRFIIANSASFGVFLTAPVVATRCPLNVIH